MLAVLCAAVLLGAPTQALQFDATQVAQRAQSRYGTEGAQALSRWFAVLDQQQSQPVQAQLKAINDFWNTQVRGGEDPQIWGQADYWATPLETLAKGWADCEDFVIGKYFSLVNLGVDPGQLRLFYVRARVGGMGSSQSVAHMVLAFYETPGSDPLILDNLHGSIVPASQRRDLTPVFSFNAQGVYVSGAATGSVERISRWRNVLARMQREGFSP